MFTFSIKGPLSNVVIPKVKKGQKLLQNAGVMMNRIVVTQKVHPYYEGTYLTLGNLLEPNSVVDNNFYVDDTKLPRWQFMKSGKAVEKRAKATGELYTYKCGKMPFPDDLDKPGRTMITGEGASSASRFSHIIQTENGKYRRLTPIELERLNMFPDNFTAGAKNARRGFFMGNALVVGVVEAIGKQLSVAIRNFKK